MEWERSWFELEVYDQIHDCESWNLLCGYRGPGGEVEIPEAIWGAVEYISDFRGGFRDRMDITGVTIPRFVKRIDGCAFAGCTALRRVTLPERLEHVARGAFAGCTSLESVDIPPYADVPPTAFPETCLLRVYKGSSAHQVAQGAGLRHEVRDEPLPPDPRLTEEEREERQRGFVILRPEKRYFYGNWSTRRDASVAGHAYLDDEGVRVLWGYLGPGGEVQIPPVGRIGPIAFRDRSDLTAVHLPLETEEIDASAFAGCTGLKTLTLPPYARLTGESNFPEGCLLRVYRDSISHWHVKQRGLRHEVLDEAAPPPPEGLRLAARQGLCVVVERHVARPDRFLTRYEGPGGEITVPQNVAVIGTGAFQGVSTLTAVTLQNVRDIGDDAFSGCTGLRSVRLSPRLEDIGQDAFASASKASRCPQGWASSATAPSSAAITWSR